LINDLLDLAKIESGRIEVKSSRISLSGLVHEVAEALRPVAAEKVIALEATLREPSILVWADRDKINQVLMNLIGNALKFTPVQGRVTVSASRNGHESVQVSVSDTGPGVPADEKEKIFAKFYQVTEVNGGNPKGTGLGLAISKALIELHGGRIWVESEPSRGSTFFYVAFIRFAKFWIVVKGAVPVKEDFNTETRTTQRSEYFNENVFALCPRRLREISETLTLPSP
jgi:signal transduction histidine kinase